MKLLEHVDGTTQSPRSFLTNPLAQIQPEMHEGRQVGFPLRFVHVDWQLLFPHCENISLGLGQVAEII